MRMNAETMKRNGVVLATLRELGVQYAGVEKLAAVSGYPEKDVAKALDSLAKQKVIDLDNGKVTEIHGFTY